MVKIASYVFFDIETTGLPHQERNRTKITELSFVSVSRNDLEKTDAGKIPCTSKLSLLFNPQRKIHPNVEVLTGLTNAVLQNAPTFREKAGTIISFLKELPKPVCLVAHNGNIFDYKILLAEFVDIQVSLPTDLLCVDSLVAFRRIHKETGLRDSSNLVNSSFEDSKGSENWPDLNISSEDWDEIDILCSSFTNIDPFNSSHESLNGSQSSNKKSDKNGKKVVKSSEKISFKLTDLYKRLLNKEVMNAHRAEDDCLMLLECVVATKEFLTWTDKYCKQLHDIKPLERHS